MARPSLPQPGRRSEGAVAPSPLGASVPLVGPMARCSFAFLDLRDVDCPLDGRLVRVGDRPAVRARKRTGCTCPWSRSMTPAPTRPSIRSPAIIRPTDRTPSPAMSASPRVRSVFLWSIVPYRHGGRIPQCQRRDSAARRATAGPRSWGRACRTGRLSIPPGLTGRRDAGRASAARRVAGRPRHRPRSLRGGSANGTRGARGLCGGRRAAGGVPGRAGGG